MESKKQRYDRLYINIARDVAEMSFATRLKVGAIAVRDGNILGMGFNGMPAGMDNICEDSIGGVLTTKEECLHAESNLMAKIAKGNESTLASTVYCTHAPCLECAKTMYQSGVIRVVYESTYRSNSGPHFLVKRGVEVEQF